MDEDCDAIHEEDRDCDCGCCCCGPEAHRAHVLYRRDDCEKICVMKLVQREGASKD